MQMSFEIIKSNLFYYNANQRVAANECKYRDLMRDRSGIDIASHNYQACPNIKQNNQSAELWSSIIQTSCQAEKIPIKNSYRAHVFAFQ